MISKNCNDEEPLNGILVVNKPPEWTSHDVVNKTKRLLGGVKVGHTGTLDPFATGVMVLLIGRATKLAKNFENDDKAYKAEITFGIGTDSYDRTGTVVESGNPETVDIERLEKAIAALNGETEQLPPMYSALKINGTRLYKLARQGKTVERKARKVQIEILETSLASFPCIEIYLRCSKGTYVRSIAHDLGIAVNCPAHLSRLERTASGAYSLQNSVDFQIVADNNDSDTLKRAIIPSDKLDFHGSI